jgi:hypothetical protein
MYVCMYVCMYVWGMVDEESSGWNPGHGYAKMQVCMYVCMCAYIHIYIYI